MSTTQTNFTPEQVNNMLADEDGERMEVGTEGEPATVGTSTGMVASLGINTDSPPATNSIGTSTGLDDNGPRVRTRTSSGSTASTCTGGGTGLPRAYLNVKAARDDLYTVRPLCGSEVLLKKDIGSFVNCNDGRVHLANHRHCYSTKSNICTSFDIDTWICGTCTRRGKHRVLRRETERPDTVDDSPICFVLSDQCFPPVLPPEGEGECMKIIRIEDGGLVELVNAFTEMSKGFVIPAGSVILLFSTSRLFSIGTESYAAEFDNAKNMLDRVMGGCPFTCFTDSPFSTQAHATWH
jgi:hypothetical protein